MLSALLVSGCTAGGFYGRYLIFNNTGSTITNLTISVGAGNAQTWYETLAGQGWIHSSLGDKFLIVSWSDATGLHNKRFSFEDEVSYRSKADVFVELNAGGELSWRVVEPPTENGGPASIPSLIAVYFYYCLGVVLVLGIPVALAALAAYGLFNVLRTVAISVVQGLHGDHSAFQFSIREIVLLTTVVALALGWFLHAWNA